MITGYPKTPGLEAAARSVIAAHDRADGDRRWAWADGDTATHAELHPADTPRHKARALLAQIDGIGKEG